MSPEPIDGGTGSDDAKLIEAAQRDVGDLAAALTAARHPKLRIPGYDLIREIQRGGQGVVYLATQRSTRRQVAIKVLREGRLASAAERARFDQEVRVLAQLNHPHIVAVHDAGEVDGHFYFAMDFVAGRSLDLYIEEGPHEVRETIELFQKICDAVHAAHQRGVIHRDLKPSNIRLDANGAPKVLDFGLAKVAVDSDLVDSTSTVDERVCTITGQFVGSIPWTSPEQVAGGTIDVRSDVYSLGVVLFQLLTGRFPYAIDGPVRDVVTNITSAEPCRPSALRKGIDDDLDTISLKCLTKEPERRYDSVGSLAADTRRYLDHQPIDAKRDSTLYVLKTYMKRHRMTAALACLLIGAITSAAFGMSVMYVHAARQAEQARMERDKADRFAEFMDQTLKGVGPSVALGRDSKILKELMDAAAKRIEDGELREVPETEVKLRSTIGTVYREIAEFDAAAKMLQPAVDLAQRVHGSESHEYAAALAAYAELLQSTGQSRDALPMHEKALAILAMNTIANRARDAELANCLNNIGYCMQMTGHSEEALTKYEEALAILRKRFGAHHSDVASSLNNIATCLDSLNRPMESLPRHEEALAIRLQLLPTDHPDLAMSYNNMAVCYFSLGRTSDALTMFERAFATYKLLHQTDHPDVAQCLNNIASCLQVLGRTDEALLRNEESLVMRKRLFPGDHPDVAMSMGNVGVCLSALGRYSEALPLHEAALAMRQRLYSADNQHLATSLYHLGVCLHSLGRSEEAMERLQEAVAMRRRVLPNGHFLIRASEIGLGGALLAAGRLSEAETTLTSAWKDVEYRADVPGKYKEQCLEYMVRLYEKLGQDRPAGQTAVQLEEWRSKLEAMHGARGGPG